MTDWTDDDAECWLGGRVRDIERMTAAECRDMLRRLAHAAAYDADRRAIWADEYWAATTHG